MTVDERSEAFAALMRATQRSVLGYVVRAGATASDADDIVADVYVVAWRRFADLPVDDPLPWLLGVARNVARNQRRGRRRAAALLDRLRVEPILPCTDDSEAAIDVAAVRHALSLLSPADRELLQLAAVEGCSPAQIAVVLDCRPVTARVRLHRARNRLRAALDGPPPSAMPPAARTEGSRP